MDKKEYMMPSMMVVKIQAANPLLSVSNDVTLHNEVSSNASYVRESFWDDDDDDDWE